MVPPNPSSVVQNGDDVSRDKTDQLSKFDFIRLNMVDLNGLHLTKLVPGRLASKLMKGGSEVYAGLITFGPRNEITHVDDVVAMKHGNCTVVPDLSTLHQVGWTNTSTTATQGTVNVGAVICDLHWNDNQPMEAYPRLVVKKLLAELESRHSLRLYSAFEPEFRAFDLASLKACGFNLARSDVSGELLDRLKPYTYGDDMYRTGMMAQVYERFFIDLGLEMQHIGIQIQDFSTENGAGQLECPLTPSIGIKAADQYFILKQAIKEIGSKYNMGASFMTIPLFGEGGSGCHFNHSLIHVGTSRNAFYDENDKQKLSTIARHWIGGLMTHMPALSLLSCPTVNCYRRLHRHLAPSSVNWDIDDRFTCLRVKNRDQQRTYMENRLPSSASSPYHVMAGTLAAGLDGLDRRLEPPPQGTSSADLPKTLASALDLFNQDEKLVEKLGSKFVSWLTQCKKRSDLKTLDFVQEGKEVANDLAHERYEYLYFI